MTGEKMASLGSEMASLGSKNDVGERQMASDAARIASMGFKFASVNAILVKNLFHISSGLRMTFFCFGLKQESLE